MSKECIPTDVAARILGIKRQLLYDLMSSGRVDLGIVIPGRRRTYKVYRAKLARYLGRDEDYVWPEEEE